MIHFAGWIKSRQIDYLFETILSYLPILAFTAISQEWIDTLVLTSSIVFGTLILRAFPCWFVLSIRTIFMFITDFRQGNAHSSPTAIKFLFFVAFCNACHFCKNNYGCWLLVKLVTIIYSPHRSSSLPSLQSSAPLHVKWPGMHCWSLHWNWSSRQVILGQEDSSSPSGQSFSPSHFHRFLMHVMRSLQRNSFGVQGAFVVVALPQFWNEIHRN